MTDPVTHSGLQIAPELYAFINDEALPGTGVEPDAFWRGFAGHRRELSAENRALLEKRETLQAQIDDWHKSRRGQPFDIGEYERFLREIGYLLPEGPDFEVTTGNVDPEIAEVSGPQLVVPVSNARYALNAANARWGSLYDALYGTDALGDAPSGGGYDPERGARVIAWAKGFLDESAPLEGASHADVTGYRVSKLIATTQTGEHSLAATWQVRGPSRRTPEAPEAIMLRNNGLHIEIRHRPRQRDRRERPGGRGGYARRIGHEHDHGLRGLRRRGRCRGQGAGLPQLARPDERRPERGGQQGWPDLHAPAQ